MRTFTKDKFVKLSGDVDRLITVIEHLEQIAYNKKRSERHMGKSSLGLLDAHDFRIKTLELQKQRAVEQAVYSYVRFWNCFWQVKNEDGR